MKSIFRHRTLSRCSSLIVALAATIGGSAQAQLVDRQLRRPDAHSFLGNTGSASNSYAQRSVTLVAAGEAAFDYFVDSEADHDFLRVYVDGTQRFQASGRNRAGRATVPIAAGTHTLRVAYEKDGATDVGRDVAFIDNLEIEGGTPDSVSFDEQNLTAPPGWTAGGSGGGWTVATRAPRRGMRRAIEGAFRGYQPSGTRSAIERQFTWPAGSAQNEIAVTYFVDSELNKDFFKVFVDGTERFAASGSQKSGREMIDVGGAGNHTIRLEYVKDESVDEGLDDAMALQLEARSNQATFEIANMDGGTVGAAPTGWTKTASADFGWVVAPGIHSQSFVLPVALAGVPPIDGNRESAYAPSTRVKIRDSDSVNGQRGEAELLYDGTSKSLLLIQRVEGRTVTLGGESGEITVYLDMQRLKSVRGGGCTGNSVLPGSEDRRIRIAYQSSAGAGTATTTVEQAAGTCAAAAWQTATPSEALPVTVAVIEDAKDLGFVRLELSVGLDATDAVDDSLFGIGLSIDSASSVSYKWPGHDGFPLLGDDISSWETVFLGRASQRGRRPRHVIIDAVPKALEL